MTNKKNYSLKTDRAAQFAWVPQNPLDRIRELYWLRRLNLLPVWEFNYQNYYSVYGVKKSTTNRDKSKCSMLDVSKIAIALEQNLHITTILDPISLVILDSEKKKKCNSITKKSSLPNRQLLIEVAPNPINQWHTVKDKEAEMFEEKESCILGN